MLTIELEILIEDRRWQKLPRLKPKLEKAAAEIWRHLPAPRRRHPFRVTLLLTSDAKIRQLNRDFRGIDRPTNVLSFPQFADGKLTTTGLAKEPVEAGDVILGYQYIVAEAKKDNKILINHIIHLLIHGILHILGYDHLTDAEAVRMERMETRIMASLGLGDPYAPPSREHKAR